MDATAGVVAGAEVEAAATEAALYAEVRAGAGYSGREREAVPAAKAGGRAGGSGELRLRLKLLRLWLQQWVATRRVVWLEPGGYRG